MRCRGFPIQVAVYLLAPRPPDLRSAVPAAICCRPHVEPGWAIEAVGRPLRVSTRFDLRVLGKMASRRGVERIVSRLASAIPDLHNRIQAFAKLRFPAPLKRR